MNERMKILEMLAAGKIKTVEAEALLAAIDENKTTSGIADTKKGPSYLFVQVEPKGNGGDRVNVRVPLGLLRAGVKLAALIPSEAQTAMKSSGVNFDLSKLNPENMDEMLATLRELSVDVDNDKEKVRVYCE